MSVVDLCWSYCAFAPFVIQQYESSLPALLHLFYYCIHFYYYSETTEPGEHWLREHIRLSRISSFLPPHKLPLFEYGKSHERQTRIVIISLCTLTDGRTQTDRQTETILITSVPQHTLTNRQTRLLIMLVHTLTSCLSERLSGKILIESGERFCQGFLHPEWLLKMLVFLQQILRKG